MKKDENSGVKWIPIKDINKFCVEQWMVDNVYSKLNEKLNVNQNIYN